MKQIVDAIRACQNETQFYRIQIAAENYLTPAEFFELNEYGPQLPQFAQDWLDQTSDLMSCEIDKVQPYARVKLSENVLFYGHAPGEQKRPHLLLAFCGAAHRLMAPVTLALQHIDPEQFDVVVLSDPAKLAYAQGIQGYARGFDNVMNRLNQQLDFGSYASVRTLGTSIGAIGALQAGLSLDAERAISVGGRALRDYSQLVKQAPRTLTSFEATFARAHETKTRVICTFGADCPEDLKGGIELANLLNGEVISVEGIASHAMLHEVLKEGRLGSFFDTLLSG